MLLTSEHGVLYKQVQGSNPTIGVGEGVKDQVSNYNRDNTVSHALETQQECLFIGDTESASLIFLLKGCIIESSEFILLLRIATHYHFPV